MTQLFLDLDGVMFDFDRHYAAIVGPLPDRNDPNRDVDWSVIKDIDFFENIPLMPDAMELFNYVKPHDPIILTGVPSTGYDKAAIGKIKGVQRHLGHVPVLTCESKFKANYCRPGDIIVDDWVKYRAAWEAKGGIWILHKNAADTIMELKELGL